MKPIVIANWKMNPASIKEAKLLFDATKKAADGVRHVQVVVAPPSIFIRELAVPYRGTRLAFALQSSHWDVGGAHTGDISLAQGKEAKATYVIIGHAERRASGETNDDMRKKVAATLKAQMTPVLCIGEAKRGSNGDYFEYIREQLNVGCADVKPAQLNKMIIAYEPVWAIGGKTAMSPRDMFEMQIFIHKVLSESHGKHGLTVPVLYGGSVDETNAAELMHDSEVQGFLVGRVSTDGKRFEKLLASLNASTPSPRGYSGPPLKRGTKSNKKHL